VTAIDENVIETKAIPLAALTIREELSQQLWTSHRSWSVCNCFLEICEGTDSVWVTVRDVAGNGFALRTAYSPGAPMKVRALKDQDDIAFEAVSAIGRFRVTLSIPDPERCLLRATVRLTPAESVLLDYWPRDLYPITAGGDPIEIHGKVRAAQRGLNTGLVYATVSDPDFGSVLYQQNLTSLNEYFRVTETTPDGRVGGQWPELGYAPPISKTRPLPAGQEITISDAFVHWTQDLPQSPQQSARLFLDLLSGIYRFIDRPPSLYHDWIARAEETIRDLKESPKATVRHYGHTYLHPYTDAEYPDSMVQLTVLTPMREFARWKKQDIPFAAELRSGFRRFFDKKLGTVRRYLPNVGSDKNANEVDSWYLYHPLLNLGRLASEGDDEARELFLTSVEFGIKVAHHFKYVWPVQYDIETLEVIKGPRKDGEPGQSDVGGMYAYLMLQAWELTENKRYLEEAKKAIHALSDMEFELEYQSNLTGWGANACLRLWELTRDDAYREQSYVFLANFFHNSMIWESEIGAAAHYPIFLGTTCLHDGPYMALYECFECFAAFYEYLAWGDDVLPESVLLLLSEFCKYTPSRAWFYYPKELPEEAIAQEIRNGHIDRTLAFPLEDLYPDGQSAGQVGQEIYGCGAAFAIVSRRYQRLERAPFILYTEYPLISTEEKEDSVAFRVRGAAGFSCRGRLIAADNERLPRFEIHEAGDREATIEGWLTDEGHWEFEIPAGVALAARWFE
jgi:hypothetical protein